MKEAIAFLLLGTVLGIPASLIASALYDRLKRMINGKNQPLRIAGTWGEFVKASVGRQYTLGRIYWDKRRSIWAFDGTNFTNAGKRYCHFSTVTSHIDFQNHTYYYIFHAELEDQPDRVYYGFGVLNLGEDERGALAPTGGHYVSDNVDGHGMSHTMIRSTSLRYTRNVDGAAAVAFVKEARKKKLPARSPARKAA